jgi:hypothetical protein
VKRQQLHAELDELRYFYGIVNQRYNDAKTDADEIPWIEQKRALTSEIRRREDALQIYHLRDLVLFWRSVAVVSIGATLLVVGFSFSLWASRPPEVCCYGQGSSPGQTVAPPHANRR